jgi:hypothetical protein
MASVIFNKALDALAKGAIDFDTDTFYCLLVDNTYTPDKDAHEFRDDVTADEVSGTGYTTDGDSVTVSVTRDDANDRIDISLGAASWTTATITARGAVYYKYRGGASSADELVAYIDFGGDVSSTAGTFALSASTLRIQN